MSTMAEIEEQVQDAQVMTPKKSALSKSIPDFSLDGQRPLIIGICGGRLFFSKTFAKIHH